MEESQEVKEVVQTQTETQEEPKKEIDPAEVRKNKMIELNTTENQTTGKISLFI